MAQLSAFESLEVVYLYRPLGMTLGERSVRGLTIKCRDGIEGELDSLDQHYGRLMLFVVTPQQYAPRRRAIQRLVEQAPDSTVIGFLLVEDPLVPATVRLRKRLHNLVNANWIVGDVRAPFAFNQILHEINKASHHLLLNANYDLFSSMVAIREIEAKAINEVGHAMTSQSSVDELMRLILEKAVELSAADAGFLMLRENLFGEPIANENSVMILGRSGNKNKFVQKRKTCKSQNLKLAPELLDTATCELTSFLVNRACGVNWSRGMDAPLARHVGLTFPSTNFTVPPIEFDKKTYAIKSYSAFPLRTASGDVVGFIVLLNRRVTSSVLIDSIVDVERYVTDFTSHDLNILESLANQAAVSLDHARLYKDLKTVFESFVQASVFAIESRDPSTKGHSERVAILTVALAEVVNDVKSGPFANVQFNPSQLHELKYAALLHDFGKIGVREDVLRKEKKLYPHELASVRERLQLAEKQLHIKLLESYLDTLMIRKEAPRPDETSRIKGELLRISQEFAEFWKTITDANEPHVVSQDSFQKIAAIRAMKVAMGEDSVELLSEGEIGKLGIRRGSLSPEERLEIESHVAHSYRFLLRIPWTSDLANIPDIVFAHHERMDGSGYPRKLVDDEIPVQAKIMAIADIYDALVAMDRPYKKAIPHERALSILEAEVKDGKLDKEIFRLFVDCRVGMLIQQPEEAAGRGGSGGRAA